MFELLEVAPVNCY